MSSREQDSLGFGHLFLEWTGELISTLILRLKLSLFNAQTHYPSCAENVHIYDFSKIYDSIPCISTYKYFPWNTWHSSWQTFRSMQRRPTSISYLYLWRRSCGAGWAAIINGINCLRQPRSDCELTLQFNPIRRRRLAAPREVPCPPWAWLLTFSIGLQFVCSACEAMLAKENFWAAHTQSGQTNGAFLGWTVSSHNH